MYEGLTSRDLTPQKWIKRNVNVSQIVISAPAQIGMPKSSFSAIAEPITSCRRKNRYKKNSADTCTSEPMMAISAITQSIR